MNEHHHHNAPVLLALYADVLRSVPSDEDLAALEQRNEERRRAAIAELGQRWLGFAMEKVARQ